MTFAGAWVQGVIGLGFAIVTVPVLGLLDPRLVPVPQMLVVMPLTFLMVLRERHALDFRSMGWILLGRLPGAALGILLLKTGDQAALDLAIGLSVLLAAATLSTGVSLPRTAWTEAGAGLVSGVTAMVSAIGGPPVALLYRNDRGPAVRANLALIFLIGVTITLLTRAGTGEIRLLDLQLAGLLLPALLLGLAASRWGRRWVEGRRLTLGVLSLSTVAGAGLVGRALFP